MLTRCVLNRRQVLVASASGTLVGTLGLGSCDSNVQLPYIHRTFGASAVSWASDVNHNAEQWRHAVRAMHEAGLARLTLVSYAFVNPRSGVVSLKSENNLPEPVVLTVLRAAAEEAASLGMEVSIRPWVEIDNGVGIGEFWRGSLEFEGAVLTEFFEGYRRFIVNLAVLARDIGARRFYIGSEMNGLTAAPTTGALWQSLISDCREVLSGHGCLLSYAANYDEYESVMFWDSLDEIGIDAYFSLANSKQSLGAGNPSDALLNKSFEKILRQLKAFSERHKRPLFICEWGVVPFDTTTADPSNEQPSVAVDRDEALRAYKIFLNVVSAQGSWLSGVDFWHWSVDPYEDSNYRIEPGSDFSVLIEAASRHVGE